MKDLNDIVKSNVCLGCGLCALNRHNDQSIVELNFSKRKGHKIPKIREEKSKNYKEGFELCPGKGYKINTLAQKYALGSSFHEDLGLFNELMVVTNNNIEISNNASSSGIMSTILVFLLKNKIIDKAIVTKFEYTKDGPKAIAFTTDKMDDIIESQGSKYCPVDLSYMVTGLGEVSSNLRYAYVGTPCQIASLRYIQNNIQDFGIKYFIGNFCGGFKSYNNLNRLIKLNKFNPKDINYFRFRGGGQPGSLRIETENKYVEIPYPEYVKMTGYTKLKRCHLCVDATAELADFACGDAWLKEYTETKIPTSIVITRTQEATELLIRLKNEGLINVENITKEKIIESQKGNIKSKKYRQNGRIRFYRRLRIKLPEIDEGFSQKGYSMKTELNVFISHKLKFIFEKLGLFFFFYYKNRFFKKVLFKLFKDNYN